MRKELLKFLFISLFLVTSFSLVYAQDPPGLPQQFEGFVEVNDDQASEGRTIYIQVVEGDFQEVSVDSSGGYVAALSGEDGSEVSFFTENATGDLIEASTDPENPVFESGGSSKTVDLDFSIESPEPRVSTGEVVDRGEDFAVLSARTRFVDSEKELFFRYEDETSSFESETKEVGSGEYEIRIEGLSYDTEYSYTAFLEGEEQINGSTKDFVTDNRPPFTVTGQTNLESGNAEAWIGGENVKNRSIDNSGGFTFDIEYSFSRRNEIVDVRVRDREESLEFISGNTSEVNFEFSEDSSDDTGDDQSDQSAEDHESDETDSAEDETDQEEDQIDSNGSDTENDSREEETSETSDPTASEDNDDDELQSFAGEFYQEQVNTTTLLLILAILGLGGYAGREYFK